MAKTYAFYTGFFNLVISLFWELINAGLLRADFAIRKQKQRKQRKSYFETAIHHSVYY